MEKRRDVETVKQTIGEEWDCGRWNHLFVIGRDDCVICGQPFDDDLSDEIDDRPTDLLG